jgi:hypothetical protein
VRVRFQGLDGASGGVLFEDYAQSSSRLPVGARTVHGLAYILIREIIRWLGTPAGVGEPISPDTFFRKFSEWVWGTETKIIRYYGIIS